MGGDETDDTDRCASCGLAVDGDSDRVVIGEHVFHESCAGSEPVPAPGWRLGRLAHWANSLGWGQGG